MNTHSVLYTVVSVVLLTGKALLLAGNLNVKTFELKASASPFFFLEQTEVVIHSFLTISITYIAVCCTLHCLSPEQYNLKLIVQFSDFSRFKAKANFSGIMCTF